MPNFRTRKEEREKLAVSAVLQYVDQHSDLVRSKWANSAQQKEQLGALAKIRKLTNPSGQGKAPYTGSQLLALVNGKLKSISKTVDDICRNGILDLPVEFLHAYDARDYAGKPTELSEGGTAAVQSTAKAPTKRLAKRKINSGLKRPSDAVSESNLNVPGEGRPLKKRKRRSSCGAPETKADNIAASSGPVKEPVASDNEVQLSSPVEHPPSKGMNAREVRQALAAIQSAMVDAASKITQAKPFQLVMAPSEDLRSLYYRTFGPKPSIDVYLQLDGDVGVHDADVLGSIIAAWVKSRVFDAATPWHTESSIALDQTRTRLINDLLAEKGLDLRSLLQELDWRLFNDQEFRKERFLVHVADATDLLTTTLMPHVVRPNGAADLSWRVSLRTVVEQSLELKAKLDATESTHVEWLWFGRGTAYRPSEMQLKYAERPNLHFREVAFTIMPGLRLMYGNGDQHTVQKAVVVGQPETA